MSVHVLICHLGDVGGTQPALVCKNLLSRPPVHACRVQQTILSEAARGSHAFRLQPEQLRVTSAESFWAAIELTADRGVLAGPLIANYSEAQAYELAHPPTTHDSYLPHPTGLTTPSLVVVNR